MNDDQGRSRITGYPVLHDLSLSAQLHEVYLKKFPNDPALMSVAETNGARWESHLYSWNDSNPVAGIMHATMEDGRAALFFPKVKWRLADGVYVPEPRFPVSARSEKGVDPIEVERFAERVAGSIERVLDDYDPGLHGMRHDPAKTRPEQPERKFNISPVYCLGSNRY